MVGARDSEGTILYERNETALKHGAAVEETTPDPHEAYAPFPHWELGRPDGWDTLPCEPLEEVALEGRHDRPAHDL